MNRLRTLIAVLLLTLAPTMAFAFQQEVIIEATDLIAEKVLALPSSKHAVTIQVDSTIQGTEAVEIQQKDTTGNWSVIYYGGVAQVLDVNTTQLKVNSTNYIKIYKPATSVPVGVTLIRD